MSASSSGRFSRYSVGEDLRLALFQAGAARLAEARVKHLPRVVPLVEGRHGVESLVALQANQPRLQGLGQHLGALGLADAGRPLEKQRLLQGQHNLESRRIGIVDDEAALAEPGTDVGGADHEAAER